MKNTGIVRKMDKLGRIAIPHELRQILQFHEREKVEIFVEKGRIVLKKYQPLGVCLVTGEILSENKKYAPGISLSSKGAAILLEQLTKSDKSQTPVEY
ncbi:MULTISPECIES: AbrB/MazE/SpoVT family DNA-binding domain-containing protein [Planococcus]|uniref:AbrB/MazE/SpoVT family DNA-binding domain-containing protein n=1 Tax=Planococcus TaxID=1372 RepID=UPI00115ECE70|nr:AbrB/MazE/SpoVT family DNA-binding domain-containing protein [Planococcus soli]